MYSFDGERTLFRHIDQNVNRADGKVSKYSLRVFLNGSDDEFEGGMSIFHVPFRDDPVVFEPETGMALLYPQGSMCTVQEEAEVLFGCKYLTRTEAIAVYVVLTTMGSTLKNKVTLICVLQVGSFSPLLTGR